MARPGLARHRKFKRLARTLDDVARGFGEVLSRGLLETLWDASYESGEPFLGDADDVEALAGWRGEQGLLADGLRDAGGDGHAGFIDEGGSPWWPDGSPGTFRVHDLWDHAPDYVRKRRQREKERQVKGAALRQSAVNGQSLTGHGPPNGSQRPPNGRTRSPSPSPSPSQEAGAPSARPASRAAVDPRLKPLEEQLVAVFGEVRAGEKYLHGGAKDTQALKRMLAVAEPAEIVRRWRLALTAQGFHHCESFAELARQEKWGHFGGTGSPTGRTTPDFTDANAGAYQPVSLLGGRS